MEMEIDALARVSAGTAAKVGTRGCIGQKV
jgi:hypothetical protein